MRVGIWCDYGFTLEPSEGIGVFVDNLARGLVSADAACEVVLMSHPGQEAKLASTVAGGCDRISVVSTGRLPQPRRFAVRTLKKLGRRLGPPTAGNRLARCLGLITRHALTKLTAANQRVAAEHIDACDVWLLPYVGLDQDFNKPTVVAIHDLVCYHFPDMLPPTKLASLKSLIERVSERATLAACMSKFIRENDLIGTLNLPPNRIRVLKPAVPDDFGMGTVEQAAEFPDSLRALGITGQQPYLLYPAAFRSYKNHAYLLDVLSLLRSRSETPWKVVFTGIRNCPKELQSHIERYGLGGDVFSLGKVSRQELERLYRSAFATVVPSLYEQGSFPVMEALECGCPVAASKIPSLVEQFACMGKSMLFFDPHDPESLVAVVEEMTKSRESIIADQHTGFQTLRENTWEKSALGWLEVFREATLLTEPIGAMRQVRQAA